MLSGFSAHGPALPSLPQMPLTAASRPQASLRNASSQAPPSLLTQEVRVLSAGSVVLRVSMAFSRSSILPTPETRGPKAQRCGGSEPGSFLWLKTELAVH